jgi:hypothetical protein
MGQRVGGWFWRARFWLLIGYGAIAAVTCIIVIVFMTIYAEKARSWPTTTGRIERTWVETVRSRYRDMYEPRVEYSYAVAGHPYRSSLVSWGGGGSSYRQYEDAARDLARDYVPGQAVQVFYDPDHPETGILKQENYYPAPFIMLPISLLILGGGLWGRRRAKRRQGLQPSASQTRRSPGWH